MDDLRLYDELNPTMDVKLDYWFSALFCLLSNWNIKINCRKGAKTTTIMDFAPPWIKEQEQKTKVHRKQSMEDMKSVMLDIARIFGAKKQ